MSEKTAAIVVTFNRKELLTKNIKMLLKQKAALDAILIIDNASTDGTREFVEKNNIISNGSINYIRLDENLGGAGGFYEGVKIGYELGYDWLWLMDDDGRPYDENTFNNIIKKALDLKKLGKRKILLNSLVICDDNNLSFGLPNIKCKNDAIQRAEGSIIKDSINPFNGTLLSRDLVSCVGYPNRDFFIKGDEKEYKLRCKKKGAYIATIVNSLYYHPKLPVSIRTILGKRIVISNEKAWKEYYRVRNNLYLNIKYRRYRKLVSLIISYLLTTIYTKEERKNRTKLMIKGFWDGLFKKMGKRVLP